LDTIASVDFNFLYMNLEGALLALKSGLKVRHRFFTSDEFLEMTPAGVVTEEGYLVSDVFWSDRTGPEWNEGWSLVNLSEVDLKNMDKGMFATGIVENSPSGVYITNSNIGRKLRWVAVRGIIHDWAIYLHWADEMDAESVARMGQKIYDLNNVKKIVTADDSALQMYRC
jgi:hypothetical protein